MMFFIRCHTDDTVLLLSEFGSVIGTFDCIEDAEDVARDRLVTAIPDADRRNVIRLAATAARSLPPQ
jgi:hypothetical protein